MFLIRVDLKCNEGYLIDHPIEKYVQKKNKSLKRIK